MVIISKAILREFGMLHPDAIEALNTWYAIVKAADWSNFSDIRQGFNSVDYVGNDRFVFNIRGNRYRLVVMIFFDIRTVYIRFIGTHNEYGGVDVSIV
ncbi:MAG: type II toxin-antitoxin system HigB family toxin [Saprospirales bacterium]|nr:type II toxin-antitoxin system HigB family toxin [Saprospirales bacterium]